MLRWLKTRTKTTIQLTLSYLAAIVAASLVYSVVMYMVTSHELVLQLRKSDGTQQTIVGGPAPDLAEGNAVGLRSKRSLRQNLIILNTSTIIFGTPLCYALARRTLRPIEDAMDNQARFSSDAAHELRTPVAALRVRNEVALRNAKLTLTQAKDVMQNSIEQATRLERLSEALLQLSRDDRMVMKTAIHLEDAANEALNIHAEQAQARAITILDNVPDVTVVATKQDVVQIISILLDNAVKYSRDSGEVVISGGKDAKRGWVCVADNGSGIRASDRKHIFERFYRADHARSARDIPSYGLGLSIAKKLVEQNGGTIAVESTIGEGSVFTAAFPLSTR